MRSAKMDRSKTAEAAFATELASLHRGIRRMHSLNGEYADESKKLLRVSLKYIDELNKVRKYACPLSTNILLSSILEALLLALILQNSATARKTKVWIRVDKDESRRRQRFSPEIPLFHFAELIELVDEMRLLRTTGVQKRIDTMHIDDLQKLFNIDCADLIKANTWDAKRNHELMHRLREFRNAVHPLRIISTCDTSSSTEFVTAVWIGLRLLAVLNDIFGFQSSIT
jgi:hypothetical protein